MSRFVKEHYYFLLGLFLLLGIAIILLMNLNKGDELIFFSQNRSTISNYTFRICNYFGEAYFYVFFSIFFLFKKDIPKAIFIVLSGVLAMILSHVLKDYFGHERPIIYFNEIIKQPEAITAVPGVEFVSSYTSSFPSGHTTAAFTLYGLMAFFTVKSPFKLFWLVPAAMAGTSRIYLGQHFLQDVIAGALLGSLIALLLFLIYQQKIIKNQKLQN